MCILPSSAVSPPSTRAVEFNSPAILLLRSLNWGRLVLEKRLDDGAAEFNPNAIPVKGCLRPAFLRVLPEATVSGSLVTTMGSVNTGSRTAKADYLLAVRVAVSFSGSPRTSMSVPMPSYRDRSWVSSSWFFFALIGMFILLLWLSQASTTSAAALSTYS